MLRTAAGRLRCILKGMGIAPSIQVSLPNPAAMHSSRPVHTGAVKLSPWRLSACYAWDVALSLRSNSVSWGPRGVALPSPDLAAAGGACSSACGWFGLWRCPLWRGS